MSRNKPLLAVIQTGGRKHETVEISQFCNTWFSLTDGEVFSATRLWLKLDAKRAVIEAEENGRCGIMFKVFDYRFFTLTGRFRLKT